MAVHVPQRNSRTAEFRAQGTNQERFGHDATLTRHTRCSLGVGEYALHTHQHNYRVRRHDTQTASQGAPPVCSWLIRRKARGCRSAGARHGVAARQAQGKGLPLARLPSRGELPSASELGFGLGFGLGCAGSGSGSGWGCGSE